MPRVATKLSPNKTGCFVARKRIPQDVQSDYERLYGVRWEARFTTSPGTPVRLAQAQLREWLTQIETRIANIRAEGTGEGQKLSPKDARALAGEWYHWYLERQQANPQPLQHWEWLKERAYDTIRDEVLPYANNPDEEDVDTILRHCPYARADIRPFLSDVCETAQFLSARKLVLDAPSRNMFLDALGDDFFAAINLLIRHAKNDYTPDTHPLQFPRFTGTADAGLSPWRLFERWVEMKKPARATVDRWRGVFLQLAADFGDGTAGALTTEQAQEWADGLITSERTPRTVRDVWLVAARTVFGWAKERNLIARNPFMDVKVSVPRGQRRRETKAFHKDEFTTILKAAEAVADITRAGAAARRWVPWLCAYTGARVGEITQLRAEDVFQQDGVDAIRITPGAGTVKTRNTRVVPLHEHLLAQGFLSFAKTKGKGPLFYDEKTRGRLVTDDPTNPRKPRYVKAREHLADWVRSLGVDDSELQPNHAWRHTFKQIADRVGISERMSDYITGHSQKSVGASYGAPTLSDMASALKRFPRYSLSDAG
jgi:integrase